MHPGRHQWAFRALMDRKLGLSRKNQKVEANFGEASWLGRSWKETGGPLKRSRLVRSRWYRYMFAWGGNQGDQQTPCRLPSKKASKLRVSGCRGEAWNSNLWKIHVQCSLQSDVRYGQFPVKKTIFFLIAAPRPILASNLFSCSLSSFHLPRTRETF